MLRKVQLLIPHIEEIIWGQFNGMSKPETGRFSSKYIYVEIKENLWFMAVTEPVFWLSVRLSAFKFTKIDIF